MIGRAAQGNPWIFAQTAEYLEHGTVPKKPELPEVKEMIRRHAGLQMKYKSELTAMREMRKHVAWYTAGYPHSAVLARPTACSSSTCANSALNTSIKMRLRSGAPIWVCPMRGFAIS